jgi:hypothetical protein
MPAGVHKRDVELHASIDVKTTDVCERPGPYMLYHKASVEEMATIHSKHTEGHGTEHGVHFGTGICTKDVIGSHNYQVDTNIRVIH